MCSYILFATIAYLALDGICTKLFVQLPGGSAILTCCTIAGVLLLFYAILYPPRKNAPSLFLPAILLLLPSILSNVLGIVLLVPAWRQWLLNKLQTRFTYTRIFQHPTSERPPQTHVDDDDVIDVDVTVDKDDN